MSFRQKGHMILYSSDTGGRFLSFSSVDTGTSSWYPHVPHFINTVFSILSVICDSFQRVICINIIETVSTFVAFEDIFIVGISHLGTEFEFIEFGFQFFFAFFFVSIDFLFIAEKFMDLIKQVLTFGVIEAIVSHHPEMFIGNMDDHLLKQIEAKLFDLYPFVCLVILIIPGNIIGILVVVSDP